MRMRMMMRTKEKTTVYQVKGNHQVAGAGVAPVRKTRETEW
jgi:hypothetical protein